MKVYEDDYIEYKLAGACDFYSDDTLKVMGYNNYKNLVNHHVPVLVYSRSGEVDVGPIFTETMDGKFKYIHPEIVKNLYDIKLAKDIYPELFI